MPPLAQQAASGAGAGFSLGGPIGAIAGGLFGGIASIFSDAAAVKAMNEKISRAQALAAEGLVDQDEIQDRLASIDRMFNQRLTSVLTTTAIRSRGFANRGTIGAAAAGQVEGARLTAQEATVSRAGDVNRGVKMSIAQMELQREGTDPVGSFTQGATAGITTGLEVAKFYDRDEILGFDDPVSQATNIGSTGPQPIGNAGNFNPNLRGLGPQMPTRLGSGRLPENYGMNWLPNISGIGGN
jgi:hypothetical protein